MKKFLMIAAMAMVATVACGEKDPIDNVTPPPVDGAPKATIVAAPTSVVVDAAGAFNVTLEKAATEDVTIAVAGGADFLTVAAAEIKITKGATTGTVAFTGKAAGSAKVTFTTTSTAIELVTKELSVTVTPKGTPDDGLKTYCDPEFPDFKTYARLDGAVIGTVTLPATEGNDFFDFAHEGTNKVTIAAGMNVVIKYANIDSGAGDPYGVGVYIDWNNDGDFKDAGEVVGTKEFTAGAAGATQDLTIAIASIPADAIFPTTMRILSTLSDKDLGNAVPVDGCGFVESGSAYDVEVNK